MDLDGTLLDVAAVRKSIIPAKLVCDLRHAAEALGGALAIVCKRPLEEVDELLFPLRLPGAGDCGAVVRMPNGQQDEIDGEVPPEWVDTLVEWVGSESTVLVTRSRHSIVLHWHHTSQHKVHYLKLCQGLIAGREQEFKVLQCRDSLVIRQRSANKARAVEQIMAVDPFRGHHPVFVGDDVTDEAGFAAAIKLGGDGLHVFRRFAGRPSEVRQWLKLFAAFRT